MSSMGTTNIWDLFTSTVRIQVALRNEHSAKHINFLEINIINTKLDKNVILLKDGCTKI